MRNRAWVGTTAFLGVVAALTTVVSPTAAALAPGCTPFDVTDAVSFSNAPRVISADGRHAAYISNSALWVVDLTTHTSTRLTDRSLIGQNITDLAIDGDGTTFAFAEYAGDDEFAVHLVERAPRSERQVGIGPGASVALSANGRRLAFTARRGLVVRNNVTAAKTVIAGPTRRPAASTPPASVWRSRRAMTWSRRTRTGALRCSCVVSERPP